MISTVAALGFGAEVITVGLERKYTVVFIIFFLSSLSVYLSTKLVLDFRLIA